MLLRPNSSIELALSELRPPLGRPRRPAPFWLPGVKTTASGSDDSVAKKKREECETLNQLSRKYVYEVRPRQDARGVNLISDALPFGRLWYGEPDAITNAIGYARFFSRSHDAVIRVYDESGNVAETHEQAGEFKEP
jgi:hypothetical protein